MKLFQTILLLLFYFIFTDLSAQFKYKTSLENLQRIDQKKVGWGFYFGFNSFMFDLNTNPEFIKESNDKKGGGISIALLGFYKINDLLDITLEPGMHLVSRTIETFDDLSIDASATYFDIPVFIKINGKRWGNTRPYIKTGVSYFRNLESKEDNSNLNSNVLILKKNNYAAQAEMGLEVYFNKFKLTPHVKGVFVLNDEIVRPENQPIWLESINSLQTRGVIFGLRFQ